MRRACLVLGAAVLWQSGVTTTFAEGGIYALVDVTRDDNLFRLPEGASAPVVNGESSRSDTYTRTEAGLKADADAGRQHFNVNANANHYKFDRNSFLDYTGGAGNVLWDWTVGNQWQGNLGYSYDRSLASFEIQQDGQDIRTQTRGFASANYRFHPSWRVRAAADTSRWRYSLASSSALDFDGTSAEVGADYIAPSESSIGIRTRRLNGDYINKQVFVGTTIDNSYDQTDTGMTLDWRLSGLSRLTAGVDRTQREHVQVPERDFDGTTGRIRYDWNETGKTTMRFAAWRDLTESDDLTASYVVADGVSLTPRWGATSKVTLQATVSHVKRDYRGDPRVVLLVLTQRRQDTVNSATLSLQYVPTPKMGLVLSYTHERRDSNIPLVEYTVQLVNAGLRVEF